MWPTWASPRGMWQRRRRAGAGTADKKELRDLARPGPSRIATSMFVGPDTLLHVPEVLHGVVQICLSCSVLNGPVLGDVLHWCE
eukprot:7503267-Pyramimonas_sp.AAC.1